MRGVVVVFTCFLTALAFASDVNTTQLTQWMNAVEEIISHVTLGPLKDDFTPEYVGKRTVDFALRKQTYRFRAHVASAIIECLDTETKVCIHYLTSEHAVKAVADELKQHQFEVLWLREMQECVNHGQGLLIKVPPPLQGNEVEDKTVDSHNKEL
jgi:hypothetical protein